MLLAVDIGNTNIVFGVFDGKRLVRTWRVPTQSYPQKMPKSARHLSVEAAIISSVAPKMTPVVSSALKRLFAKRPVVVGRDVRVPMKNLYRKPEQVGQDRLVNALAAYKVFKRSVIIVDYGTAITFDVVSARGEYIGGLIFPGIEISSKALTEQAALLPRIKLAELRRNRKAVLGRDTVSSMRKGMLHGYGVLTDGLVDKLRKEFGKKIPVVATGGYAKLVASYCKTINKIDPNLTLKGLRMVYESMKKKAVDNVDKFKKHRK